MFTVVYNCKHLRGVYPGGMPGSRDREVAEMLVLGRNLNETIVIDGKIFIKIVRGKLGGNLKVAIEAPREVSIVRGELFPGIEKMEEKWQVALGLGGAVTLPHTELVLTWLVWVYFAHENKCLRWTTVHRRTLIQ